MEAKLNEPAGLEGLSLEAKKALLKKLLEQQNAAATVTEWPLTVGQSALGFLHRLEQPGTDAAYNTGFALQIRSRVHTAALEKALQHIYARHPLLAATFNMQTVNPSCTPGQALPAFEQLEANGWTDEAIHAFVLEKYRQPFNLEKGPVSRCLLLTRNPEEHIFLFAVHHIVYDDGCTGLLIKELIYFYLEACGHNLPLQLGKALGRFLDYALAEQKMLAGEKAETHRRFWKAALGGAAATAALPGYKTHTAAAPVTGGAVDLHVASSLFRSLKQRAQQEGTTVFAWLLANFQLLLYKYTGSRRIRIGVPVSCRKTAADEDTVGYYVNLLPVQSAWENETSFADYLRYSAATFIAALEHKEYPFALITALERETGETAGQPLVNIAFNYLLHAGNMEESMQPLLQQAGLSLSQYPVPSQEQAFDITFELKDHGDHLRGVCRFRQNLYDAGFMEQLCRHFLFYLQQTLQDPAIELERMEWVLPEVLQQIEQENATANNYAGSQVIQEVFAAMAAAYPQHTAIVAPACSLSYQQLDTDTNRLARFLSAKANINRGTPVALLTQRNHWMITGILAILKAGGAYVPVDADYPAARIRWMLEEAGITLLLCDELPETLELPPGITCIHMPGEWEQISKMPAQPLLLSAAADDPAYIMFTSGSTGTPKGAVAKHSSIVNLVKENRFVTFKQDDQYVLISNYVFDGSTFEIFGALLNGACLHILPATTIFDAPELIRYLRGRHINMSFMATAFFNQLADHDPSFVAGFDHLVVGGEAISMQHLRKTLPYAKKGALINAYGPTECTTFSLTYAVTALPDNAAIVPIGKPLSNVQVYVLDSRQQPVPPGVAGELYIGGKGVCLGYLNRPDLNREKFIQASADPSQMLYATGDLVCRLPDGNIHFIGRKDQQLKFRGYRIEPGEIEAALQKHPQVRSAIVHLHNSGSGNSALVAFIATEMPSLGAIELKQFLDAVLPHYMIPARFYFLPAFPLNQNSKVNRKALYQLLKEEETEDAVQAMPLTPVQQAVAGIWQQLLNRQHIGLQDDFFELGGHSLLATRVTAAITAHFGIAVPLAQFFRQPTIAGISDFLEEALRQPARQEIPLRPASAGWNRAARFALPASAAQRRLWILSQFNGASEAYNIIGALHMQGAFRENIFEDAVKYVVSRHESLRTTFERTEQDILQVIHPQVPLHILRIQLPEGTADEKAWLRELMDREVRHTFDLASGPLFRIIYVQASPASGYILFCMHHLISDGWSLEIFVKELSLAYNALLQGNTPPLPALPVQYSDFTLWQEQLLENGLLQHQLEYWRKRLEAAPALLELPLDFARPPVQTFTGSDVQQACSQALSEKIYRLCRQQQTTPYVVLLAAFKVLLYRYTAQSSLVVGSPVANRGRKELEGMIGFFVNTIPLYSELDIVEPFASLVSRLKQSIPEDFSNQEAALEKILEVVPHRRSPGYHPLFQVMFSLHGFSHNTIAWEGIEATLLEAEGFFSKFDLTLSMKEEAGQFREVWEYNTALFEERTIRQMAAHFHQVLEQVLEEPSLPIEKVTLLEEKEREQLLFHWNDTTAAYPQQKCFHELFEQQAAQKPLQPAVVFEGAVFTYTAVNEGANRLAHYLLQQGLHAGQPVAICLERSTDMLIALLAVMKAGGVYVPVDPALPPERKAYLLADAGIRQVLTTGALKVMLPQQETAVFIELDTIGSTLAQQPASNPSMQTAPHRPVYIIYTSGSTGVPKGVMISHRSLLNFLYSMLSRPGLNENDRLLAVTSLSFDIAGLELYLPLLAGATVVIAGRDMVQNGKALMECMEEEGITVMQATPATWLMLLNAGWEGKAGLKVLCGGEAFPRELANSLVAITAEVWNMYGPTETTIWSATSRVTHSSSPQVPIGRPIANTTLYILDAQLQSVPVGITGDLYIGGDGLALGYHGKPELTAARFIAHPFLPGEKIYNTGDRARYLPEGDIVYAGRSDFQVKVNGYRIEPEEVTWHLSQVAGIRQAVTGIRTDSTGMNRLVAYLVPETAALPVEQLRTALLQKLPVYMVPSQFVYITAFPLTPNGKIDHNALKEMPVELENRQATYEAPTTTEEKILAGIWQEVLRIERIGVHDNFFDLGGASLQSITVVSKAAEAGLVLGPEMLFEFQTIKELAAHTSVMAGIHTRTGGEAQEEMVLTPDMLYNGDADGGTVETGRQTVVIESLACYLPEKVVSAREILEGCVNPVRFPMERLTGIKSRREVAEDEYAFDMAVKAMEHCFAMSSYRPEEIDVLISCNVFRIDGAHYLSIEPATAIRLAGRFGCSKALTFDISNACAGIFTGILLAETFIRNGKARKVMLVSGEYLTHLTRTAQQEITDYLDLSISALTVGDSGLAMILTPSADPGKGFLDNDLFTMGAYSDLCIVKATGKAHGGLLLKTDAIRMAEAGHREASRHALRTLKKNKWGPDMVDFLIMHQASSTTTANTMREVNRLLNSNFANRENTIDNIQHRGNTATTTHWMAIQDHILEGKIKENANMLLFISGSGLNIGTALYRLDNLPEKMMRYWKHGEAAPKLRANGHSPRSPLFRPRTCVRIVVAAGVRPEPGISPSAISWATAAAEACLAQKEEIDRQEIGVLLYAGMYRDEHLFEPAIAAILAGNLSINATAGGIGEQRKTLCFDVFNSNMAFMQACHIAAEMLENGLSAHALVSTAEIEVDSKATPGIYEGGAAMLLQALQAGSGGFGSFLFHTDNTLQNDMQARIQWKGADATVYREMEATYLQCLVEPVCRLVNELLQQEELTPADIRHVIPPFMEPAFVHQLETALQLPGSHMVRMEGVKENMQSLTLPCLLQHLMDSGQLLPGERILIISAGAGGQIGGTIYYH